MKILRWKKLPYLLAAIIAVIVIALAALLALDQNADESGRNEETGQFVWESAGDETDADAQTTPGQTAAEEAAREVLRQKERADILLLSDEELWERFDDAVLIGDSRVEGFRLYTSVPSGRILAQNGATILHMDSVAGQAADLAPESIFIAYGINDIKSELGKDAQGYAALAEEKIGALSQMAPEAEIYVNSILPASPARESAEPVYRKVPAYNEALHAMCERRHWHFVDNSGIAQAHSSLYVDDGIHLTAGFYRYWGQNMLLTQLDGRQ